MTTAQQAHNGSCSPPPRSLPIDPLLNEDNNNANPSAPGSARCRYLSYDKRQCRMLRVDHPDFCLYHAARQDEIFALLPEREFSLAPELEDLAADLTTATAVNRALGQVFRLLAQNRITRKDAVAFGYIAQLLLQTVPGVRAEAISAFGLKAWDSQLKSALAPQPQPPAPESTAPAEPVAESTPVTLSSRATNGSEARSPRSGSPCGGSLSSRPIHEKTPPPATHSPSPADSASTSSASATRAFSRPNYADLLNRSVDLLDGRFDASPESQREAQRLLRDLERIAPHLTPAESALPQTRSQPAQNGDPIRISVPSEQREPRDLVRQLL